MVEPKSARPTPTARNRIVAIVALAIAIGMVGAAYAAVPLYFLFCRATGFAGTTQVASAGPALRGQRELTVRFDANVTPGVIGGYFDKISCFCFSEQRLGPKETAELPVVFFLDPKLEQDATINQIDEIALSYTLFAAPDAGKPVASAPQAQTGKSPL
jgi:cytochrome c oxidase assembly protein subunit 11